MSTSCEQIRPLLAALVYEEADEATREQIREHLGRCVDCRRRQQAYLAVRQDLQQWRLAAVPPRISVVAPPPWARRSVRSSGWLRGMGLAAGLALAVLLAAAVADLEVRRGPEGWSFRAGLWEQAAPGGDPAGAAVAEAPASATDPAALDPAALDRWLEEALASRGLLDAGRQAEDAGETLSPAERQEVNDLVSQLLSEHDQELQVLMRDLIASSEARQQQQLATTLTDVYENLQAQRADDLFMLASQMGLVQADTGQQLQRANAAIDFLLAQVASATPREPPRE